MLLNIFNTVKDLTIKKDLKQSFKSIEKQVEKKINNTYSEPLLEPAIKYLDLNCMLLEKGWRPVIPRHPRESDK